MEFISLNQIQEEFNISSSDPKEIKIELMKMLNKIHPDKNGGKPKNAHENELVIKLNKAINFIDSNSNETSLTVVTKTMTDLIQVMTEQGLISKNKQLEDRLDYKIESSISASIKYSRGPKITLTAISAGLSFIYLIPDQVSKHPILSTIIKPMTPTFQLVWFIFIIYTILLWLFTYLRDEKNKNTLKSLKLESVQKVLFMEFLHNLKYRSDLRKTTKHTFSKIDFVNYIMMKYNRYRRNPLIIFLSLFNSIALQEDAAQDIADIVIKRAVETDIIQKDSKHKSFIENYRVIDFSILEEKEY